MTRETPFELERFEQLLDVHGADLERWPEALRAEARGWLASSPAAQQAWSRAERLGALLDAVPDVLPSAELSARIAALPVRHPQGWAAWWPFGNPLAPLFAWGAAAAFGLCIGSGVVPGLDSLSDVGSGASVSADVGAAAIANETPSGSAAERDDVAANAAARSAAVPDSVGRDALQADDWNDFELALGLGPDWEDEP